MTTPEPGQPGYSGSSSNEPAYGQPAPGVPPYGQPAPGTPPYGQQYGQPAPGGYPPGIPLGPTPIQPNRRRRTRLIVLGIVVVLVIGGIIWNVISSQSDPGHANAGDCVTSTGADANSVKKVDCHSANATFKVLGVINNVSDPGTQDDGRCQSNYASYDVEFWEGNQGQNGTVLCLQKLKP